MKSAVLAIVLFAALALFALGYIRNSANHPWVLLLLLGIALLALVGLLGHWGLPIASDIINGISGT